MSEMFSCTTSTAEAWNAVKKITTLESGAFVPRQEPCSPSPSPPHREDTADKSGVNQIRGSGKERTGFCHLVYQRSVKDNLWRDGRCPCRTQSGLHRWGGLRNEKRRKKTGSKRGTGTVRASCLCAAVLCSGVRLMDLASLETETWHALSIKLQDKTRRI
ncbi:hypothetical protein ASPZODRAFT_1884616 [Penicilliopsis zonata CBS 506.65]|uniref:Uncharacterized protein n=1 Tax=Penicilliopsis zonata CBS 506.65 TaxID=1073090 RepID=A0A1L9SIT9_9EURO|nr:hypothetical protein ASPZODRAFT_1884616 [Penicilliopsis zonata CBS 506.65]OJJ47057.1 hypothetical protein ASPZODRAFT_1884616 [Penicilliopsis zonata CBS 506.65]